MFYLKFKESMDKGNGTIFIHFPFFDAEQQPFFRHFLQFFRYFQIYLVFFVESLIQVRSLDCNHEVQDDERSKDNDGHKEEVVGIASLCVSDCIHLVCPPVHRNDSEDVHN